MCVTVSLPPLSGGVKRTKLYSSHNKHTEETYEIQAAKPIKTKECIIHL